jgi:FeS assembly SUF system protein
MAVVKRVKQTAKKVMRGAARQILKRLDPASAEEAVVGSTRDFGLDQPPGEPVSARASELAVEEGGASAEEPEPVVLATAAAEESVMELAPVPVGASKPPVESHEAEEPPESTSAPVLSDADRDAMRESIVEMIQTVHDPEIPVNIYELGLIYDIDVAETGDVEVRMTLTAPNCPAAQILPGEVEVKTASVKNVRSVMVDVVWDPPWDPSMMSESAQLALNMF